MKTLNTYRGEQGIINPILREFQGNSCYHTEKDISQATKLSPLSISDFLDKAFFVINSTTIQVIARKGGVWVT